MHPIQTCERFRYLEISESKLLYLLNSHSVDASSQDFMVCMAENDNIYHRCKEQSKIYLKCRMERNLMAPEDLSTLGFGKDSKVVPMRDPSSVVEEDAPRVKKRIAGMSHLGAMKKRWSWLGFGTADDRKTAAKSASGSDDAT